MLEDPLLFFFASDTAGGERLAKPQVLAYANVDVFHVMPRHSCGSYKIGALPAVG